MPDGQEDSAAIAARGSARAVESEAFFHLTANVTYPLMVVFSAYCCRP